ncbi:MAG: hypothetical protein ACFFDF_18530 [Candidatus Odinarchaeota archaeon]
MENCDSFKLRMSQIYISYVRKILDLKDFILNTPLAIRKYQNERIRFEKSRYIRYPLEKMVEFDINLVLEMTLIKIFSEYENFLTVFFYELKKVNSKYRFRKSNTNIMHLARYLEQLFNIKISSELTCWDKMVENYYRRNAYVHTKGKINKNYIQNVPNYSENDMYKKLWIDLIYVRECTDNILELFEYLFMKIVIEYFHCNNVDQILLGINERRNYGINSLHLSKFKLKIT